MMVSTVKKNIIDILWLYSVSCFGKKPLGGHGGPRNAEILSSQTFRCCLPPIQWIDFTIDVEFLEISLTFNCCEGSALGSFIYASNSFRLIYK